MFIVGPFHIIIYIIRQESNQLTIATRTVVFTHLLTFWLITVTKDSTYRLLKYLLQSFTGKSTALKIFALQLTLYDSLCSFFGDRCWFWIFCIFAGRLSQIDFIAHKYFDSWRNYILDLREPLHKLNVTFFLALVKDEGYTTEKAIRKTSVPGYASGLNLPNSSWPAVSLDEKRNTKVPNW